jgi:hypothetical protein
MPCDNYAIEVDTKSVARIDRQTSTLTTVDDGECIATLVDKSEREFKKRNFSKIQIKDMQQALSGHGHALDYESTTRTHVTVTDVAECRVHATDVMLTQSQYEIHVLLYDKDAHSMLVTEVWLFGIHSLPPNLLQNMRLKITLNEEYMQTLRQTANGSHAHIETRSQPGRVSISAQYLSIIDEVREFRDKPIFGFFFRRAKTT